MNKFNVPRMIKSTKDLMEKHSPEILTGLGLAGMITTTVLAVKATPKALQLIEEKKDEEQIDELTPIETVKAAWKPYIPAAVTGTFSIACLIGANSVNARRNAALATAYKLSETAFAEYRDQVVETIGEKKEEAIRENVAKKKVEETPVKEVYITGGGETLFLDPVSKRHFKHDIEAVRRIINDLNYRMVSGMEEYISLSDLYIELGLETTDISDSIGWNLGRDGQIKIDLPPAKLPDGRPCLLLDYHIEPRYNYMKLM